MSRSDLDAVEAWQDATWHDPATGEVSGAVVATRFRVVGGSVASLARHDTLAAALDDAGLATDDEVVAPTRSGDARR